MEFVERVEDFDQLKENRFIGVKPNLVNTKITFKGTGNILYCEDGVNIEKSVINFNESNALVYLGSNTNKYYMTVSTHYDSVLYFGLNNFMQTNMRIILSEQKNIVIGDDGLFSGGIHMRVADPHLIYDCLTKKRLNYSKSIYIGDHVWLGHNAMLLKGTEIGSGSIVGGGAVVAGKKVPSNTSWVGNPAKQVGKNIFFSKLSVHSYRDVDTDESQTFKSDKFTYSRSREENIPFSQIEENLNKCKTCEEKLQYLQSTLVGNESKNRFYTK
jgi:acetyltransferase-like isoleucine patch superfamily enzyme